LKEGEKENKIQVARQLTFPAVSFREREGEREREREREIERI
jgi:hypothetical protein